MKKLMFVAAFGAAALFTACSDDSSSSAGNGGNGGDPMEGKSVVSCDVVATMGGVENHTCNAMAADDPAVEAFKTACAAPEGVTNTVYTVGDGCAKAELSCEVGNMVQNFYGEGMDGFTCEQMATPAN